MEAPPPENDDTEDNVVVNVGNWVAFDDEFSDPFDIDSTKNASHESLKRWRVIPALPCYVLFSLSRDFIMLINNNNTLFFFNLSKPHSCLMLPVGFDIH